MHYHPLPYHWSKMAKLIKAQPGFNEWRYFHRARKYARTLILMDRIGDYKESFKNRIRSEVEELFIHYSNLCYAAFPDAEHDIKMHRNNVKYLQFVRQYKFKVGTIIKIIAAHGCCARDYGVGESVRVTEIVNAHGNCQGVPHIRVQRVRDGYVQTSPVGMQSDREVSIYDASHFIVFPKGLYWHDSAREKREFDREIEEMRLDILDDCSLQELDH